MRRVDMALVILVVLFMGIYSMFVLYFVGPQTDCLSVRDFAAQLRRHKLRVDATGLLEELSAEGEHGADPDEGHRVEEVGDHRRHRTTTVKTVDQSDTRDSSNRWVVCSNSTREIVLTGELYVATLHER